MDTSLRQLTLPLTSVVSQPANPHLNFPLATMFTDAQLAEIQRNMSARFPRRVRSSAFTRYHRLKS